MSYHAFRNACDECAGAGNVGTPFGKRQCHECDGKGYQEHGSFEVFEVTVQDAARTPAQEGFTWEPGWYWWACFPGCLPDGEACGPFKSADEAEADALSQDD